MGIPENTCVATTIDLEALLGLSVNLPGGVTLGAKLQPGEFPSLQGVVASVLDPLNAALTPLMPFFNLLDVVVKIIEFAKSIPDAFGPPPNPTTVIEKLQDLLEAAAKLTTLIPPLSVPVMIVGICNVIVAGLNGLIETLEHAATVQASLDAGRDRANILAADPDLATGAALLSASIDCAQADLDLQLEAGINGLGPLNKFIELLNAFASLAGLPEFVSIEAGSDPTAALEPLKAAVSALETVCGSIPV